MRLHKLSPRWWTIGWLRVQYPPNSSGRHAASGNRLFTENGSLFQGLLKFFAIYGT